MKIAGLQKLSLVDFPGHLASTIFIQGCNFHCGYCYNKDLVSFDNPPGVSKEEIFNFLTRRKEQIEGVVITGGEPLASGKDLKDLIKHIKNLGFKIKLDTNGSNPKALEELLHMHLLDYVAVDIKTSLPKYSLVVKQKDIKENLSQSISLVMSGASDYEFRTTCVPGIIDEEDFSLIGEKVKGAKKYCLQQFRPMNTYDDKFKDVKPYPKETLQKFQRILQEYVRNVEIRGI